MGTYTGGNGDNTINGSNGNDTITGGAGDDILNGGNGNDVISGGADDDTIDGGNANDVLNGDDGDDTIVGGNGNDLIDGGTGNDIVAGSNGNDVVYGGSGNDDLSGGNGDDQLTGGAGDDTIDGGNGFDTAYFSGPVGEYSFSSSGGYLQIYHLGGAGPDGHDQVRNVERLVFLDRVIDLTGGTNNAPVAVDDHVFITEDTGTYSSGSASVKDNDFDFEGQPLTVTPGVFTGTYGTLTLNANGTYTYTLFASAQSLAQGQNVTDSFNYTVSDGSHTDTGALVFHIAGLNDAPVANPDTASGTENQLLDISVLANDTDVDNGAVLTVTAASVPAGQGSASVVGNKVRFDPGTDFDHLAQGATATVVVTYSIQDEHGASSSSTVTITVTGTNDAPVAHADTASTTENAAVLVNVLANDTDADDGAVLTVTSASAPAGQGSASVVGNQVRFDPGSDFDHLAAGATATVVVSYSIQDEHGASSASTVTITVTGTNDAPVAHADTASTDENSAVLVAVLANDTDVDDGAVLTVTSASAPAGQGSASVVGNQVRFDPGTDFDHLAAGATATVVVSYTIQDEHGASSSSTVTITVTGTNDAPVAHADSATTDENSAILVAVLANDTDVDDGAVLTVTSASAPAGQGSASVVGNQVRFDPGTDFDHLAAGATATVVVNYSIQDEHGASSSSTVTITVTGTNDAPVAHADSASTTENAAVLVNVLANDTDVDDGAVLTVTSASAPAGQGSASVVGNQVRFDPGTDFDHLAAGATATVVVSYTIQDEHGASSASTVTVTVTGSNDAPVANPDTASTTENAAVLVNVLANDTDVDDGAVLTVTSASVPAGQGSASVVGNQVRFDPGADFDHLAAGATATVVVNYTIQDEHGASAASTATITVTGTNDAPVANPDASTTSENASVTINVLANDTDVDDGAVLTVTSASAPSGQGSASVVGNQVQFNPGTDFDHLAVGETATVVVSYSIQDEHGATSSSTATITVTGTNDAPVINAGGTDASGGVTELPDGSPGENSATLSDSGTIAFSDVDTSDTHSASFAPNGGGYLGTFSLDPVNQSGDTVQWHYSVSDAALDSLNAGQTVVQTYTVTVDDGHGGTANQVVTITLTGAADGPDGTNWYIDNSAVGSTQDGSAANPYLSIAAFNAAQGSPTGPGVNDNIFLLAGTGTYAEPDGINLLDGQVLTGVPNGALRPTIVATAGDGIDLAHDNTIAHVDIGSTSGVGIADGGTSVGTLNVSDVAKSGSGQIVDIDQGGTLNVTLNSASSTGSSGGAIDLQGVGGSFTIAGATTITGSQLGGGIGISGSSINATFGGGGIVTTGATDAVSFTGNSGALTLANGFHIVTTSGAGLAASGGGTLTVQGGSNSIAADSGVALNVANTAIGAPGLTFESISAGTAVGTAGVGISLVNTGSAGGLTVTGNGLAGSGGVIQHKIGPDGSTSSGVGIYLDNTSHVSLNDMNLHDFDNQAIFGQSVDGIRISNSSIGGVIGDNAGSNDAAIAFGTTIPGGINGFANGSSSLFDNVDISGSVEHNVEIHQQSGTFNLTITGSTIHDNSTLTGSDGVNMELSGTAHGIVRVSGTTFDDNASQALQASALGSSQLELTLDGNTVLTTTQGKEGFVLENANSANLTAAVTNNTFTGVNGTNIAVGTVAGTGTSAAELDVNISGNTITLDGPATNRTIQALFSSINGQVSTAKVAIENNVINTISDPSTGLPEAIFASTPDSGSDPLIHLAVNNNTVNISDPGLTATRGITIQSTQNVSQMHADIHGNHVNFLDGTPGGVGIRLRDVSPATLDLEPGVGGATAAAVLANNNPGTTTQVVGGVTIAASNSVVLAPAAPATPSLPSFLLAGFDAGLLPAHGAAAGGDSLTQAQLDKLVDAAIHRWADAGASADQIAAMHAVSVSVADLFGRELGVSDAGGIVLDSDAAGYGWFVDATPGDDSEFRGSATQLTASAGGAAAGRMDALSVVMHELGHQIGLADGQEGSDADLMHGLLDPGQRLLPGTVFATELDTGELMPLALAHMPAPHLDLPL